MPVTDIYLKLIPYDPEPQLVKIVQRSYGPNNRMNFHIQNADGTPYNIQTKYGSNPFIQLILYRFDKIPWIYKIAVNGPELTQGQCYYDPLAGDFVLSRTRFYYVRVSLQDGNPGTSQELTAEALVEVV